MSVYLVIKMLIMDLIELGNSMQSQDFKILKYYPKEKGLYNRTYLYNSYSNNLTFLSSVYMQILKTQLNIPL